MNTPEPPMQTKPNPAGKRAGPQWLLGLLRADQQYWNWIQERAPIFVKNWFEWLNWIVILAALEVVATKFKSRSAGIVLWISYLLILYYFISVYWGKEQPEIDRLTGISRRSYIGWIFAFIQAFGFVLLARALAAAVSRAAP